MSDIRFFQLARLFQIVSDLQNFCQVADAGAHRQQWPRDRLSGILDIVLDNWGKFLNLSTNKGMDLLFTCQGHPFIAIIYVIFSQAQ